MRVDELCCLSRQWRWNGGSCRGSPGTVRMDGLMQTGVSSRVNGNVGQQLAVLGWSRATPLVKVQQPVKIQGPAAASDSRSGGLTSARRTSPMLLPFWLVGWLATKSVASFLTYTGNQSLRRKSNIRVAPVQRRYCMANAS